jgi:hypothetical protein
MRQYLWGFVKEAMVKCKNRLEVELQEWPRHWANPSDNLPLFYLLVDLWVEFWVSKECVSFCDSFILDTGSPITWIRRERVEKCAGTPLSQFRQAKTSWRGFDGKLVKPLEVQRVRFPHIELELPKALITNEEYDKPFGLLGMDFLMNWIIHVDPSPGVKKAVLDRIET